MNDDQRTKLADEAADSIQSAHLDPIRDVIADAIDGAIAEILQPVEEERDALKADRDARRLDQEALREHGESASRECDRLRAEVESRLVRIKTLEDRIEEACDQRDEAPVEALKQARAAIVGMGPGSPTSSMGSDSGVIFKKLVVEYLDQRIKELT